MARRIVGSGLRCHHCAQVFNLSETNWASTQSAHPIQPIGLITVPVTSSCLGAFAVSLSGLANALAERLPCMVVPDILHAGLCQSRPVRSRTSATKVSAKRSASSRVKRLPAAAITTFSCCLKMYAMKTIGVLESSL